MNEPLSLPSPSLSPSPSSSPAVPISPAKTRWPLAVAGVIATLGGIGAGAAAGAYSSWRSSDLIAPGVSVAGVGIGGLTKNEARAQIEKRFGVSPLKLRVGPETFETSLARLGGAPSIDFTLAKAAKIGRDGSGLANFWRVYGTKTAGERLMLPVVWDKSALLEQLQKWDKSYASKPVNARLEIDAQGARVIPERAGRSLNLGATARAIQTRYFVGTRALKAYTRTVTPAIGASDLAGQDKLLATYKTRFNAGLAGRTRNIRVACAAIDGQVLMPGETFSFNEMTGRRTWEKGYRMAHIFETKPGAKVAEVVDGLAGGVCQVSSTIFNAVRRANEEIHSGEISDKRLEIVERNSHSLPVTYVPRGLDATVAWPSKDFRFRNTLEHPIWLRTAVRRGRLTIAVWARTPQTAAGASPTV